jgi:hypothetical protein
MTASLAPVVPRISQLIRLLGSDNDGECLGAARAIGRTLASVDLDFHDLALSVESSALAANHRPSDHHAMALWILRCGSRLTETERGFVNQMLHWRNEPTERQANWLLSIFERVSQRERRA